MLREQKGIYSIKVALLAERGIVEYNPDIWDADKLINVSHPVPAAFLPLLPIPSSTQCPLMLIISLYPV